MPARSSRLLQAWAMLVFVLAVRAFAAGVLPAPPPMVVEPVTIDLNRASVAELRSLPGIGRTRAEAIVLERIRHGAFADVADLQRVDGIGPAACALLAGCVSCGGR